MRSNPSKSVYEDVLAASGKSAIEEAIESHIKNGGLVTNPPKLIEAILRNMGLTENLEYKGWSIVRTRGDVMKLKGNARCNYGYVATKGDHKEQYAPSSDRDCPVEMVYKSLDLLDQYIEKLKRPS